MKENNTNLESDNKYNKAESTINQKIQMYDVQFTKEEIVTLLNIVDIAVQSKGLLVAEVAVHFFKKFNNVISS